MEKLVGPESNIERRLRWSTRYNHNETNSQTHTKIGNCGPFILITEMLHACWGPLSVIVSDGGMYYRHIEIL